MRLSELYKLWEQLGDIPVTADGLRLAESFLHFEKGAGTQTVWRWFESQNPQFSVAAAQRGTRMEG